MEYADIRRLYTMKQEVAVTIKMDINLGVNPKSEHDRITLKNMVSAAQGRLLEKYKRKDVEKVLENLDKAAAGVAFDRNYKGLVLFVSEELAEAVLLPFAVGNKLKVGRHFSTRTLLRAFSDAEHYYILNVSQQEVGMMECYDGSLLQVKDQHFPVMNELQSNNDSLKASFASAQDKETQKFFRIALEHLDEVYKRDGLPIVLAGPEEAMANFEFVAGKNFLVIGKIRGNYDSLDGARRNELIKEAYKHVHAYKEEKLGMVQQDLETARGKGLVEFDLNAIYEMAQKSQIAELVVDRDYYEKAVLDTKGVLHFHSKAEGEPLDDAVNHILQIVKAHGGDIVFVPDYSIDSHHRMAALLRWR